MKVTDFAVEANEKAVLVNGRSYRRPQRPVVVICFDGCDPEYLSAGRAAGVIPNLVRMMDEGFHSVAQAAMPTFTNPNNVAIACGAPPAVTGVAGNYYLDRATGREVMVLDGHQMRAETIFAGFSAVGVPVTIVTAKDKLLRALARNHEGIALSAEAPEHAADVVGAAAGLTAPDKYSADLSLFVLDAGVALLEQARFEIAYLSLSDFVQHKFAPAEAGALEFMAAVDHRIGRLLAAGATVGIVADHGMHDMADAEGKPRVVYVQDLLEARFGQGSVRVICPITDPFVRHHASLGGFVRVYIKNAALDAEAVRAAVAALDGVGEALLAEAACSRFELPAEGEADVVVVADLGVALGATATEHDLTALAGRRLRSHGGTAEQPVPFIVSRPLTAAYAARAAERLRNFDIFDFTINGVQP
ncbi:MAG TPA: phosphonoacetate hydrolase [Devosia sp.]|uniref:phosphonoacetate hydrolase n=1 Tax=Devosia sp. TaxID=1871048 RepID=UPI002DDD4A5B|nr:phosphonoacetate hydrolase [Devosia sp.]HEV2518327.1 phosphonoacetate hydrolase [Devosia sp.]